MTSMSALLLALLPPVFLFLVSRVDSATFATVNKCSYTVWPGLLSGAGTAPLSTTGFALQPGESNAVSAPSGWSGWIWGRTLCTQDAATGKCTCLTGDCDSSTSECSGGGAAPPSTLAEFTLNGAGGHDFYGVSLVDGYNLHMLVVPQRGGNCTATGCAVYLNGACPAELKVLDGNDDVACESAYGALGDPQYCRSGAYGTFDTCKPSSYSEFFKSACPKAYSYAYDDGTSAFTCASADYVIIFCPQPTTSVKTSDGPSGVIAPASSDSTNINPSLIALLVAAAIVLLLFGQVNININIISYFYIPTDRYDPATS